MNGMLPCNSRQRCDAHLFQLILTHFRADPQYERLTLELVKGDRTDRAKSKSDSDEPEPYAMPSRPGFHPSLPP